MAVTIGGEGDGVSDSDLIEKETWIEHVLGVRLDGGAPHPDDRRAGVRLTQAMMLWNSTRMQVGKQINTLQSAILAAAEGDEQYPDIVDGVANLEDVMNHLDDSLGDVLSAIRATPDWKEKAALSKQARDIVKRVAAYVAGDALLADIDTKNGFVTLEIKPKVTQALSTILQML